MIDYPFTIEWTKLLADMDFTSVSQDKTGPTIIITSVDNQFVKPEFQEVLHIVFGRQFNEEVSDDLMHEFVEHWLKTHPRTVPGLDFKIYEIDYDPNDMDPATIQ